MNEGIKKYIYIVLTLLYFCTYSTQPQTLQNTIWGSYIDGSMVYIQIISDTLYGKTDIQGPKFAFSKVSIVGDTFIFVDLPGNTGCNGIDTGQYIYQINSDTLNFKMIYDNCAERDSTFSQTWIAVSKSAVEDVNLSLGFILYSNPANEFINIDNIDDQSIQIFSAEGILVYQTSYNLKISNAPAKIDVSGFAPGVYYVKFWDRVCRFVKI